MLAFGITGMDVEAELARAHITSMNVNTADDFTRLLGEREFRAVLINPAADLILAVLDIVRAVKSVPSGAIPDDRLAAAIVRHRTTPIILLP